MRAKRDAAVRAGRLANGVTEDDIYRRILGFGAALDAEAHRSSVVRSVGPRPVVTGSATAPDGTKT